MKWKIAIAGLGEATRRIHLPAYVRITDLEVVGGADPCPPSRRFPFPVFATAQELLDRTRPDILVVATPPDTHFSLTRLGLEAGCHVFCEKPFMPTLAEGRKIISLSRSAGRWVVVNNQYRFMNVFQECKRRIGRPEFGELLFINAQQTFRVSAHTEAGWRGMDVQRTCKEFGTHVLDLCRFLFDAEPVQITARMPRPTHPDGPDLLNLILLEFPGDRLAQITLDRLCRGPHRYLNVRLNGSAGCIETSLGGKMELAAGIRGTPPLPYLKLNFSLGGRALLYQGEKSKNIAREPLNVFAHATRKLMSAFLEALNNDSVPPCHAEDNLRTLALMIAAYESDKEAKPLSLALSDSENLTRAAA